ncbi:MAG: N-formylglutamate amidohydrolase [Aquisalinus sp.]|nr:N-formylglutamate amidohydrolase [Aquisalinus sp.]
MTEADVFEWVRKGKGRFFLFCDHASNFIPPDYENLGLSDEVLETHIAWDPGAVALATELAQLLEADLTKCTFSRLLIDPNRAPDQAGLVPAISDNTPIPGNQSLSEAGLRERVSLYNTYHEAQENALDEVMSRRSAPFILSLHSFTPRMTGATVDRPWHLGVLWNHDEATGQAAVRLLAEMTGLTVGDNEPYDGHFYNHALDRHAAPRGLPHMTLEVRQDLLSTASEVKDLACKLAPVFIELANSIGQE